VAAIISFFFFGIEELSIQLEEPFSILPLVNMTEGMGLSAREFAEWHLESETYDPDTIGGKKKMFKLPRY
jgi:ion channel-forming bestrophin family protein